MKIAVMIIAAILLMATTQLVAFPLIENADVDSITESSSMLYEGEVLTGRSQVDSEFTGAVGLAPVNSNE